MYQLFQLKNLLKLIFLGAKDDYSLLAIRIDYIWFHVADQIDCVNKNHQVKTVFTGVGSV